MLNSLILVFTSRYLALFCITSPMQVKNLSITILKIVQTPSYSSKYGTPTRSRLMNSDSVTVNRDKWLDIFCNLALFNEEKENSTN